jgi:hypothetical protein
VRFRLPLRFNPLGRPGGPHPSVCGASAVVLVIITARRSGSPVATAIAALGRCVQFFRITAASVVGCTRPSAPRSSSGTVLGPRMPARPLAILPAAAEIDARPLGQAAENGQHQATMGRRGVGPASPMDRKASTLVGQLPPCLPLADASPGTRRGRCLGRRYDRRRYRRGNRGGSLLDQTASTCLASAVRKESLAIELIEFATIPLGGAG